MGHDLGHAQEACTGSFGDLPKSTNFENIKIGQILLLSKSGSWVPVDACNFFGGVIN